MSRPQIYAILCNEPYDLRPWEIAELTDIQISHLLLHPRDDSGKLDFSYNKPPSKSFMQVFYDLWKSRGLSDEEIAERFAKTYPDYPV